MKTGRNFNFENVDKFKQAMRDAGLVPPEHIIDTIGRAPERFAQSGDKDKPCWYVFYDNGVSAGAYGCFKRDINQTWCSHTRSEITSAQRKAHRERIDTAIAQLADERRKLVSNAALECQKIFNEAISVSSHPYLELKQVSSVGIKQSRDSLVIPLYDENDSLVNVQFIFKDGKGDFKKRFKSYGRKKCCYFPVGNLNPKGRIYVCEGYATSASVHAATGDSVIVAFDSGNLKPVVEVLKKKYPEADIIISGDNDWQKEVNVGLKKAEEAAIIFNVPYVFPVFGLGDEDLSDFNDVMCKYGKETVKKQIANIKKPESRLVLEARVSMLSELSALEYEQVRECHAKNLNVRVSVLDDAVKKKQEGSDLIHEDSKIVPFMQEIEPSDEVIEGAALAEEIFSLFDNHLVVPDDAKTALTLWAMGSYVINSFNLFSKLCINSPQKRCGKTTCLDVLSAVVNKPLACSNITPSAIFRSIEKWQPTLLIDEGDTFLASSDELRGIINAGHKTSTAFVVRTEGDSSNREPKRFSVWAPTVIAMIGSPSDTIADRSIFIKLKRKSYGDKVRKVPINIIDDNAYLRSKIMRWAIDNGGDLRNINIDVPIKDNDRAADNWCSLLAIASLLGDDWLIKGMRACINLTYDQQLDADDEDISLRLLRDIKQIFFEYSTDKIHSEVLVIRLLKIEESPWSTAMGGKQINTMWISKKVKPFGIKSTQIKIGGENKWGYRLGMFEDAWKRYLPSMVENEELATTATTAMINSENLGSSCEALATTCHYPLPSAHHQELLETLPAT